MDGWMDRWLLDSGIGNWELGIRGTMFYAIVCAFVYIYMNEKYKGYNSIMGQKDERRKTKDPNRKWKLYGKGKGRKF